MGDGYVGCAHVGTAHVGKARRAWRGEGGADNTGAFPMMRGRLVYPALALRLGIGADT